MLEEYKGGNNMDKTKLTHIKENNGEDISEIKIYFDDSTQQHKRRMECPVCKVFIQCMCYESLNDAVEDCIEGTTYYCNRHYFETLWRDDEMYEMVDKKCGTDLSYKMKVIEMIENGDIYPNATDDYRDERIEAINDECDQIIHKLSDKQIDDIVSDMDFDCEGLGSSCDV